VLEAKCDPSAIAWRDGGEQRGMGMTVDQRPEGHHEIGVLIAVHIPNLRPLATLQNDRSASKTALHETANSLPRQGTFARSHTILERERRRVVTFGDNRPLLSEGRAVIVPNGKISDQDRSYRGRRMLTALSMTDKVSAWFRGAFDRGTAISRASKLAGG